MNGFCSKAQEGLIGGRGNDFGVDLSEFEGLAENSGFAGVWPETGFVSARKSRKRGRKGEGTKRKKKEEKKGKMDQNR